MMKLLKFISYMLLLVISIFAFFPKENIYFFIEKKLEEKDIVISQESTFDNFEKFSILDGNLYIKNIKMANIKMADIYILGFMNNLNMESINLDDSLKNILPLQIDSIKISHSIFNPLNIHITSDGDFGSLEGNISLISSEIDISLTPSKLMKRDYKHSLKKLTSIEGGIYEYHSTF